MVKPALRSVSIWCEFSGIGTLAHTDGFAV